ncbi:MAG: PqqD family protein [bacterium]
MDYNEPQKTKASFRVLEDNIFCLKDHILFAIFEEGGVVFNIKDRMSYLLNQTAAGIIDLSDGRNNIRDIISKLARYYEKPEESVRDDVRNFFKNLLERDWVHVK